MQKIMAKDFWDAIIYTENLFRYDLTVKIHTERWQGMDIRRKPEMSSYEVMNYDLLVPLKSEDLDHYRQEIKPNLPWADDHFLERVCGEPLNPAKEWENWPWASSADRFRDKDKQFNHNYLERYWPRYAGMTPGGKIYCDGSFTDYVQETCSPRRGIRHGYGDMMDLVKLLAHEPHTRQAWIPIFFPEDTGIGDGGRKPCTLGYQFIMRNGYLNVWYPLRSCDFIRHFRDDIYLTVRLLLWVLDQCRMLNPEIWNKVRPGTYEMHCTSLHIFENDMIKLRSGQ